MPLAGATGPTPCGVEEAWRAKLHRLAAQLRRDVGGGQRYLIVTIPSPESLTEEERHRINEGASWPVRLRLAELPPEQCRFIEFLADAAMAEWGSKCE